MNRYRILLLREICHQTTLVIEAETSTDAMKLAVKQGAEVCFEEKFPTEYRCLNCVKITEDSK